MLLLCLDDPPIMEPRQTYTDIKQLWPVFLYDARNNAHVP